MRNVKPYKVKLSSISWNVNVINSGTECKIVCQRKNGKKNNKGECKVTKDTGDRNVVNDTRKEYKTNEDDKCLISKQHNVGDK